MAGNSPISRAGTRSRKPTGFSDLTAGTGRRSNSKCVLARENRGTFLAIYIARVRLTVHADGATIIREGHGTGEGHGPSPGEVHDIALKAAETDATKRALATFGKPFGLELYRSGRATVQKPLSSKMPVVPVPIPVPADVHLGFHPDDTTPIPRPSRYYGRRQNPVTRDRAQARRALEVAPSADTSIVPSSPGLVPARIDKSVLTLAEPRRLRDKTHLRFVAAQPCLVCGRQPSDPHHLRFAQPRALGLKVSDEFTVPLCRGHHRQLHQAGDEVAWWNSHRLEPLGVASTLWRQTHSLPAKPQGSSVDELAAEVKSIANGNGTDAPNATPAAANGETKPIPSGSP